MKLKVKPFELPQDTTPYSQVASFTKAILQAQTVFKASPDAQEALDYLMSVMVGPEKELVSSPPITVSAETPLYPTF